MDSDHTARMAFDNPPAPSSWRGGLGRGATRVHASNHPSLTLPVEGREPEEHLYGCLCLRLCRALIVLLCAFSLCTHTSAQPVSSFDDVQFWTGVGANRAVVAIDWDAFSSTDPALVWGFRWDGVATGEDLLRAVVAADDRLFAKISTSGPLGISVWGVGYDANNDGQFALSDGTQFDDDGVAVTGLPDEDATPTDPADWYREGWFTGIWSYGTANQNPWPSGAWTQSQVGPSGRTLVDGAWDSWAFASPIQLNAFAANPVAAKPQAASDDADFDADGDTDGADFLTWQRGVGATTGATRAQGDANGDAAIDALDLEVWKSGFGPLAVGGSIANVTTIPEPPGLAHAAFVVLMFSKFYFMRRKISCVSTN
jgi:hypothetical protein